MALDNDGTIRVVVMREGDLFVAQCLEVDIGAEAHDLEELDTRLGMTLRAEFINLGGTEDDPFPNLGPAPEYFQNMWDKCKFRSAPVEVPGVDHGTSYQMAMCA
jgi:hypothetical protein